MAVELKLPQRLDRLQDRLPRPLSDVVRRLRGEDLLLSASSLGFYALVSMVPLVIVAAWLTSLLAGDQRVQQLSQVLTRVAPDSIGAGELLRSVARQGTSLGVGAMIAALWPATAYGSGLVRAFDRLSPGSRELRGIRGRGLAVMVILPVFVIGGIGASYLGTTIFQDGALLRTVGWVFALVGGFLATAAVSALIYFVFPKDRPPWPRIVRASISTAVGVSILSALFVLYLSMGANFKEHYASSSVAGIVLMGVWLFVSNALLLASYEGAIDRSE